MRHFYSRWPRFLQVSRMVLVVSMILAIFQLPAHAQRKERPVEHPTFFRLCTRIRRDPHFRLLSEER